MKRLFLLPAFLLLSHTIVFSQGCLPEGITFTTQEQIDNFQTNYPGCTEIEGDVIIGEWEVGSEIFNLTGLSVLNSIGGGLEFRDNYALVNLTGLDNLISIGGWLYFSGNGSLISLTGLENLSIVGFMVYFNGNESLSDLSALSALTSSIFSITVINCDSLHSLTGLENFSILGGGLHIFNNYSLSDCDVQSICEYLADPGGTIEIQNNHPGCNNPGQVIQHCLTSLEENKFNEEISIFPNPASSFITINIKEGIAIEEAIIYNHLGQKVLEAVPVNNTVDVSGLKAGIYFIEVATKEWRGRAKLIIN